MGPERAKQNHGCHILLVLSQITCHILHFYFEFCVPSTEVKGATACATAISAEMMAEAVLDWMEREASKHRKTG